MPQEERPEKKDAAEAFGEMVGAFGNAVSEIFKDPKLKEKAKEFGKSAAESAEAFVDRFKDEDVKSKFRDVGKAAQDFGKSIADYFKESQEKEKEEPPKQTTRSESVSLPPKDSGEKVSAKVEDYFDNTRSGRITSSSFAIAWSIVLLIFFVYFSRYIAYYQPETVANVTRWVKYPVLTAGFYTWLPVLIITLVLTIIGHIILIIFDRYLLRQSILIILNLLGVATVVSLLSIFPFDFSVIPNATVASILPVVLIIVLVAIAVGVGIGALVQLIKSVVHVATPKVS